MSKFIQAKGQNEIVNLSKVTHIRFSPNTKDKFKTGKIFHNICFYFDSMTGEDILYSEWSFQDKSDYDKTVSFLEGYILEVM